MSAELRHLVAQLLVVRASGHLADAHRRYPRWELSNGELQRLLEQGVGGVILLGGSAAELRLRTLQLQAWSDTPLLLCADVEEGVGQRFEGASWLAPPLALSHLHGQDPQAALALAERYGQCTGREARAVGLNWLLAPVCDVNNNPANPVINVRAWGEDPDTAGALACAFLRGAQAEGVLCCAKHFPGHGDTSSDTHLELPTLPHSRERLEAVELPPFRRAIAAGVASVMTAHLLLPSLDRERPATLSAAVLTDLLRHDLGFEGLVVTDALVMEAIAGRHGAGEAAVMAVEAGADVVLMPADADAAIEAILAAIAAGRLSPERIEASLRRRERALASLPPRPAPVRDDALTPLASLRNGPLTPDRELARELLERSLERQGPLLNPGALTGGPGGAINLIRIDNALASPFLPGTAPALTAPEAAGLRTCLIEGHSPSPWTGEPERPLALERLGEGPVLLQLFVRGNPFRGSAGGGDEPWEAVIRQLQATGRLAALAVYGSPYLWRSLAPLLAPSVPAAWSPAQMPLAQALVLSSLGLGAEAGASVPSSAGENAPDVQGFTD